jgi:hypothetical protein
MIGPCAEQHQLTGSEIKHLKSPGVRSGYWLLLKALGCALLSLPCTGHSFDAFQFDLREGDALRLALLRRGLCCAQQTCPHSSDVCTLLVKAMCMNQAASQGYYATVVFDVVCITRHETNRSKASPGNQGIHCASPTESVIVVFPKTKVASSVIK